MRLVTSRISLAAAALALAINAAPAWAQVMRAVTLDPRGTAVFDAATATVTAQPIGSSPGPWVQLTAVDAGGHRLRVIFSHNDGALTPGTYDAMAITGEPRRGAINVPEGQQFLCSISQARFVVFEAEYSDTNVPTRFAANAQFNCQDGTAAFAEFRYDSTIPLQRDKAPGSTSPDPLAFASPTAVRAGTAVTSNRVGIWGITTPVPVQVTGGEYSQNGGPFTSAPGTATLRDVLVLRAVAPSTDGTTQTATLQVGDTVGSFHVRAYKAGETLTELGVLASPSSLYVPAVGLYPYPRGMMGTAGSNLGRIRVSSVIPDFDIDFATWDQSPLRETTYRVSSTSLDGSEAQFALTKFYPPNCFSFKGRVNVREAAYSSGQFQALALDMEIFCEQMTQPWRAQLRYRSTVAFPLLMSDAALARRDRPALDTSGDKRSDLAWRHADGRAALWTMNGATQTGGGVLIPAGTGWTMTHAGDLNGDGKDDLLWRHSDGRIAVWLMDGATQTGGGVLLPAATGWSIRHVADFDGDGKSDLLWQHDDGRVAMWRMDGARQVGGAVLLGAASGWTPIQVFDLDGDGRADILWEHADGRTAAWLMNGTSQVGGGLLLGGGTGWRVQLTADLDGDGKRDLVWMHTDGRVAAWLMDGMRQVGAGILRTAGNALVPKLAADLNGDARMDLVWIAADGTTAYTFMDGARTTGGGTLANAGAGPIAIRAGDFDGDGIADLVLGNADGSATLLTFDVLGLSKAATLIPAGTGWVPAVTP